MVYLPSTRYICYTIPSQSLRSSTYIAAPFSMRGNFHCIFREGFRLFCWLMVFYDQRCFGLFLQGICRFLESLLKSGRPAGPVNRQMIDSFGRPCQETSEQARSAPHREMVLALQASEVMQITNQKSHSALKDTQDHCPRLSTMFQWRWHWCHMALALFVWMVPISLILDRACIQEDHRLL